MGSLDKNHDQFSVAAISDHGDQVSAAAAAAKIDLRTQVICGWIDERCRATIAGNSSTPRLGRGNSGGNACRLLLQPETKSSLLTNFFFLQAARHLITCRNAIIGTLLAGTGLYHFEAKIVG